MLSLASRWAMYLLHSLLNLGHLRIKVEYALFLLRSTCRGVRSHRALNQVLADGPQDLALTAVIFVDKPSILVPQLEFEAA